jgi:aspartate-semialdehyde dehydrogenase
MSSARGTGIRVAVGGATGNVGSEMLRVLEERAFPASEVIPLASAASVGRTVRFRGRDLPVCDLATFDFSGADLYPAHTIIRYFLGSMTRKLSVTSSQ